MADSSGTELPPTATALIEEHLPLVRHVVFQVATRFPRHVDREELVRAGEVGLVEAARRYDPERGVPFARFAAQRIRGAVLDAVRSADWAPRSVRTEARKLEADEQALAATLGRTPSRAELAEASGTTLSELADLQDRVHRSLVLALDHRVADGGEELPLSDVLTDRSSSDPVEWLEQRELHAYLRDAVDLLPERHRRVIAGYFFEGRTSDELAEDLAVTTSRISQLRTEAMAVLKDGILAQYGQADTADRRGVAARRRASYAEAIGRQRAWRDRLEGQGAVAPSRPLAVAP